MKNIQPTCHSGGALGADHFWGECAKIAGFLVNHYYYGSKTPYGNICISKEEYEDGVEHVKLANKTLKRNPWKYMSLLARNWAQVKNSTSIFAIGKLVGDTQVDGGTGWAVQMAIDADKPVFVFDQVLDHWFSWDKQSSTFIRMNNIPDLTIDFAGIGTRKLEENGRQAIRDILLNFLINNPYLENEIS